MKIVGAWQHFAQLHLMAAVTFLVLPFTACVVGTYALEDIVYDKAIPGALAGAIAAFYLAAAFVVGLTAPLRVAIPGPVLGFLAATLLWPLTPGRPTTT